MFRISVGRRAFLKVLTVMLVLAAWGRRGVSQAAPPGKKSRVVVVHDAGASPGPGLDNADLDPETVERMVNHGLIALTGAADLKSAWKKVIPDPSKRVAVKVNCQIRGIYTKAKVVQPVLQGLMLAGVPADNILVYDMTDNAFELAGFKRNLGAGVKVGKVADFGGYSRILYHRLANLLTGGHQYSVANLVSNALHAPAGRWDCDYLINIPVLKALDGYCGVTLSMKNNYGSIGNPGDHHKDIMDHIPLINSQPEIKDKTRLIVMDAIFGEYQWVNGRDQSHVVRVNKVLLACDTVAIDATGWRMIDALRKEHDLPPVAPRPEYIAKAAALGLGVADPSQIELVQLETGKGSGGRGR